MLSKAPSSKGNSSKRFACDRCRGQKLRCVRECTDRETCKRCFRVGAVCVTSSPLRMGRPSRAGSKRRRQSTTVATERAPSATMFAIGEDHMPSLAMELEARSETPWLSPLLERRERAPAHATDDDSTSKSNTTLSNPTYAQLHPWQTQPSEPMATLSETLGIDAFANARLGESDCDYDQNMSILTWPWTPSGTSDLRGDPINAQNPGRNMLPADSTSLAPAASLPPTPAVNAARRSVCDHVRRRHTSDSRNRRQTIDIFAGFESWQNEQNRNTSMKSCRNDCIQQLSELNVALSKQLLNFTSDPGPLPLPALTSTNVGDSSSSPNHVGDILHSSQEFLKVLNSFLSFQASESLPLSATSLPDYLERVPEDFQTRGSGLYQQDSINTSGSSSDSSLQGDGSLDSSGNDPSVSPQVRAARTDNTMTSDPLLKPDTPVILLILTCYVHIIRIYSVLFARTHRSLLATLSGHGPPLPAFSGLQISGFPLQSGSVQVQILIAVVVDLLNRIEKTMGLPLEYRVSRGDVRSKGMLSDSHSIELFKVVIKQEERAGVKTIREHIRTIKHLLKDSLTL